MSKYIDNTPKKENKQESKNTNLGETGVKINTIKPADSNRTFKYIKFTEVGLPTSITTNVDTNTYDVLADTNESSKTNSKENDTESDDSDNDSIDIDEIFKDHINIAFIGTLSIVGLFILFRMIQKSR
jgi:hypothetical protein